jgi:hypothetical protein
MDQGVGLLGVARPVLFEGEDVVRLSPLAHEHVNMLGRYTFTLPEPVARGELRPSAQSGCLFR